jgi:hypothetical protein
VPQVVFLSLFLGLITGIQSVNLQVDDAVKSVGIELAGREVARMDGAPWSAKVDFGHDLLPTQLTAIAYDAHANEIARTSQLINLSRPPAEVEIVIDSLADLTSDQCARPADRDRLSAERQPFQRADGGMAVAAAPFADASVSGAASVHGCRGRCCDGRIGASAAARGGAAAEQKRRPESLFAGSGQALPRLHRHAWPSSIRPTTTPVSRAQKSFCREVFRHEKCLLFGL